MTAEVPRVTWVEPPPESPRRAGAPILVVRYASSDADPVDAHSVRVRLDGRDVTATLEVGDHEAWGLLSRRVDPSSGAVGDSIGAHDFAPGDHRLGIHVCTIGGACADVERLITIEAAPTVASDDDSQAPRDVRRSLLGRILELLMDLVRRFVSGEPRP